MLTLDKSQFKIRSLEEFHGYLENYLLSIEPNLTLEQANSHLVFLLSFVCLFVDASFDSRCLFSIVLSGNAEHILFRTARMLTESPLFCDAGIRPFLIAKLLLMLDLNLRLHNINLKIFLGFVLISLFASDETAVSHSDESGSKRFDIGDVQMAEDQNGNKIPTANIDSSAINILTQYSSFKIFYRILYFNHFHAFYEERARLTSSYPPKPSGNISPSPESFDTAEDVHLIEHYRSDFVESRFQPAPHLIENFHYSDVEDELIADEKYFLENYLEEEKKLLFPDTTNDLVNALDSLCESDFSDPQSADIILSRIIANDSELMSTVHAYKKHLLSKVYMRLIASYLNLTSVPFSELLMVGRSFVKNVLLQNLSIFDDSEPDEENLLSSNSGLGRRASVTKRGSVRLDNGLTLNDKLSKDLVQFTAYKTRLKKLTKLELFSIKEAKFQLILSLHEQYIMAEHSQSSLKRRYLRNILAKTLQYRHLKLVQIKSQLNHVVEAHLKTTANLQRAYEAQYDAEAEEVARLQSVSFDEQFVIDTDDLYARVSEGFKDELESLSGYEAQLLAIKERFESGEIFVGEGGEGDYNEFCALYKKEYPDDPPDRESLRECFLLSSEEILQIIRPTIKNVVFCSLIGTYYFENPLGSISATMEVYVNFIAYLIYSFNRQTNNCSKILILKMLHLILKEMRNNNEARDKENERSKRASIFNSARDSTPISKSTFCEFYYNDLKVLVDIFVRELYDLSPDTQVTVVNNYLRVLYLLLEVTPLNYLKFNSSFSEIQSDEFNYDRPEGYKRREIVELLLYLGGFKVEELAKKCHENNGQFPDILLSDGELLATSPDVLSEDQKRTRKLARKCLSVKWLGVNSYIVDKAFQLYCLATPNDGLFRNPLTRSSTSSSTSLTTTAAAFASTERLTLLKKLSNLRLTHSNTGVNTGSPKLTSPLKASVTGANDFLSPAHCQHYSINRGGVHLELDLSRLSHSQGAQKTYKNDAHAVSALEVPSSSPAGKHRKKPPPPPPALASRGTTPNLEKRLPPPPPPRKRGSPMV